MAKQDIGSRIEQMLTPFLSDRELEVYKIEYKKEGPDWKLRVFLDKTEGAATEYVSIDECETVTRYLSDQLDAEGFIERSYTLEVSSPGLDRELMTDRDFTRFIGRAVEVKLYQPLDGAKQLEGVLIGLEDGNVAIEIDGNKISILRERISKINLAIEF